MRLSKQPLIGNKTEINYGMPDLPSKAVNGSSGDAARMSSETPSNEIKIETNGSFLLGRTRKDDSPVELPVHAFKRHFMALGGSGSGKTVLCKCVIEEAVRNNIPVLIIDPQGDISSLAIKGNPEELEEHGTSLEIQ